MPSIAFPRRLLVSLQDTASRLLETRAVTASSETFARELLGGFAELCTRAGLDGVLAAIDLEDPGVVAALVAKLDDKSAFDARGPRTAKPRQLADCLIAALSLELVDPPDRTLTLSGELRGQVLAAIVRVVEAQLAAPQVRDAFVSTARARCEEHYLKAFDKIAASLDERGLRAAPQPKMPLDAVQAVHRVLADARATVVGRAASEAIDRARDLIARTSTEAAERIDQPISLRLTPREVAIRRVTEPRASTAPEAVAHTLLDSLTELAELGWRLPERSARPYAPSQTFAVGDVVEHPKFGRGTVQASAAQRIDVEFSAGLHTLVHARK